MRGLLSVDLGQWCFLMSCRWMPAAGVMRVIELAAVDAEELEGLVEVGLGKLGRGYGMIKSRLVP